MYPLKFEPILKQTLWGGDKIIPFKHLHASLDHVGESWEVSAVEGSESIVANGADKGRTLPEMVRLYREELVGEANYARFGNKFPLLIKFIDAKQDLSIQVHPDDAYAGEHESGSLGKKECWYVLSADEGSTIVVGQHARSREEFAQVMFREIEALKGRFVANQEKWGDSEQYPQAIYEMELPSIEKPLVRRSFPYFKSFLSCQDGIMSLDFVLRETTPVMRIHYVKSMWDDARIWKEIFQAEKWTLRMADGTFKESDPQLKFSVEGHTVEE